MIKNFKFKRILVFFLSALVFINVFAGTKVRAATVTGQQIVDFAKQQLGKPYKWGAEGPSSFDCSGLVKYVYGNFGIKLTRTTYTQVNEGVAVSKNNLQLGDLVFFGSEKEPHHVGIYVGNNSYIHAPQTGDVVKISSLSSRSDFSSARRILSSYPTVARDASPIYTNFTVVTTTVTRTEPHDAASTVQTAKAGTVVDVYAEYGDWYLIARGTPQWVKKSTLKSPAPTVASNAKPIYTNFTIVAVTQTRILPFDAAAPVQTTKVGTVVDVYAEYGDWYLIARGTPQWVRKSTLKSPAPTVASNATPIYRNATVITTTSTKILPFDAAAVVQTVKAGTAIDVYAEYGDWYLIARGTPQWVKKSTIKLK